MGLVILCARNLPGLNITAFVSDDHDPHS